MRSSGGSVCGQRARRWPILDSSAPDGLGQGFVSERTSALVNWGFRSGGYDKIVSTTMAVNEASRRVMEKIDIARTVPFDSSDPIPGSEHGEVWYELMRSGWNGS